MAVTRSDVEKLSSTGWSQLDNSKKDELLAIAERQVDNLYSGRISTFSAIEGNREDLIKFIAAHQFELAEGGESQSENSTGGSVTYNTVTGEVFNSLSETRYGRAALEYLRDEQSIGVVRTR